MINISYKISINYGAIKMQIVMILSKSLNTPLLQVRSVSILQFSEHFQLIFDSSNVNKRQTKNMTALFIYNLHNFSYNFSSSSFWGKPLWNQKLLVLTETARCSCYTLVREWNLFQCWVVFHFFTNFLELILATIMVTMLLKQPPVIGVV